MVERSVGKILVVDDEVELNKSLVEALTSQGYEASGFTSGEEALVALRGQSFDVLLADLTMPEMDGIKVVEESLQIDPHLIPIMMTGQGTIQTAVEAMKVGAFDYVLKPFRLQIVLPVLTRAMNARHIRLENLQLRETVAIYELAQTIAFTLDPQTVVSKLADAALQQTDADEVSVLLPTSDGSDGLYVAAVRGENRQRLLGERVPMEESISGWVARQREPLILDGAINDDRFRSLWPHPEIRSAISIPMQVANKLIGTININALDRPRPFTLGQMKALTILASTAAAALESASLYTQVRRAEENYRTIFENAIEGIFQTTLQGRLLTVNPALARLLGYDSPEEVIQCVTDLAKQIHVNPEDWVEADRRERANGILQGFEFEAYRKDGQKIWLSLNRHRVCDEAGTELYREGSLEDITERKQADEERARLTREIEKQRERLDNLVSSVPGVVWEAWVQPDSATQRINFVSDYVEPMLGYSVEEWLATPNFWLTIVHPDDQEEAARIAAEALASGKSSSQGFRWMTKDGRAIWVESNYVVVKDDAGRSVGLRGVTTDIDVRKRAEQALRESEERYRDLVENAHDIIFAHDLKGNFTAVNRASEQITGYTREECLSLNITDTIAPEDLSKAREMLARKIAGEKVTAYEVEILAKDGKRIAVEVNSKLIWRDGVPVGVQGIARDISQRKRTESDLVRLAAAVEQTADSVVITDPEGNIQYVNPAFERITGYAKEEVLDKNPRFLKSGQTDPVLYKELWETISRGEVWEGQLTNRKKDGTLYQEHVTISPVQDKTNRIVNYIAVKQDISDLIHLEDQLRQSQKMEAIGQLAGGVAHDFNNLLTAINGYSGLALQRIEGNPSVRNYLEEIKKAGDRAANLTRQLLAFGRKQILQPIPLSLNDVITDMNKMLRRLIGEDIELTAKLDPALKKIKADPGQVEQVLVNLIVNARDAMPQGGNLTIETATVKLDQEYASKHVGVTPGEYVLLAISDTGTGMDEETQMRIFDPFFTTKEPGKGTGLGLSTVYGIVKQSGGDVWVYSEIGHGTTFKIYLPLADGQIGQVETEAEAPAPGGSETILLVEDEGAVRGLARQILEQAGYTVLEAKDGEAAINLCTEQSSRIDLLLTDVVMPRMSGKEVAERVLALRDETSVLFMSGYTDEAIVHHGILDSDVEFIQKPFTPIALAKKVREVLDSN